MFRRRRPLARAALIGGGAYAIGKRRGEVQAQDAQAAAPAEVAPQEEAAPAGGLSAAAVEQLEQLGKLREEGILTQEEFDAQKQKLLGAG